MNPIKPVPAKSPNTKSKSRKPANAKLPAKRYQRHVMRRNLNSHESEPGLTDSADRSLELLRKSREAIAKGAEILFMEADSIQSSHSVGGEWGVGYEEAQGDCAEYRAVAQVLCRLAGAKEADVRKAAASLQPELPPHMEYILPSKWMDFCRRMCIDPHAFADRVLKDMASNSQITLTSREPALA